MRRNVEAKAALFTAGFGSCCPLNRGLCVWKYAMGWYAKQREWAVHSVAQAAEVKWIKRFRRDCLNDLEHEQRKRDWKNLVNADEVSRHD